MFNSSRKRYKVPFESAHRVFEAGTDFRAGCWGSDQATGEPCDLASGHSTDHPGVGRCRRHGGASAEGRREAAWLVAHELARELDVSPWQGMLIPIRDAAARAAFYKSKIGEAPDDEAVSPGGSHHHWVVSSERAHRDLAEYSRSAINAGVAERFVEHLELEAGRVVGVLNAALRAVSVGPDLEDALRMALRNALLAEEAVVGGSEPAEGVSRPWEPQRGTEGGKPLMVEAKRVQDA